MLRVLFRIGKQCFRQFAVFYRISGTAGCSGNRVDVGTSVFNFTVSLRRRTENAVSSEIEIEKIRRRVDAAKSTINFEIISGIRLDESSGKDNLKNITTHTMGNTLANVRFMFLIGDRAADRTCHREIIRSIISVFDSGLQFRQTAFFTFAQHFYQCQFILEMIENDDILI